VSEGVGNVVAGDGCEERGDVGLRGGLNDFK